MDGISRTPAETRPEELIRQSGRIKEQYENLKAMLETIREKLDEMSTKIKDYSPNLNKEMVDLESSIASYGTKAEPIYTKLANSLYNYGNSTIDNLASLTQEVSSVKSAVEDL